MRVCVARLMAAREISEIRELTLYSDVCRIGRFLGYCLWTGEAVGMPLLPSVYTFLLNNEDLQWRDVMLDAPKVYTGYIPPNGLLGMSPEDIEAIWMVGTYTHTLSNKYG